MKTKTFDCVEMKRQAQEKIRAAVAGMSREQEIEFFREGHEDFKQKLESAREAKFGKKTTKKQ